MGKENKDYCKEYRKNHLEEYRETDRQRKQNKRAAEKLLKPDVYKKKKEADALRKKLYRQRKKLGLVERKKKLDDPETDTETEPQSTTVESETPVATSTPQPSPNTSSSFTTKQSKFRSVSRAEKALPNSPNKRKEVVGALSEKFPFQLRIKMKNKPGPKKCELTSEEEDWLHDFLNRGDISYVTPGRADNVYIGKRDSKRQYLQKRYLLWKLRDLHDIINGSNLLNNDDEDDYDDNDDSNVSFPSSFDKKLSFSLMYSLLKRCKQYVFNKHIPHSTCLCEVCENVSLLAKGLNKSISRSPY